MLEREEREERDAVQGHRKNFQRRIRRPQDKTPGETKQKHMSGEMSRPGSVARFLQFAKSP